MKKINLSKKQKYIAGIVLALLLLLIVALILWKQGKTKEEDDKKDAVVNAAGYFDVIWKETEETVLGFDEESGIQYHPIQLTENGNTVLKVIRGEKEFEQMFLSIKPMFQSSEENMEVEKYEEEIIFDEKGTKEIDLSGFEPGEYELLISLKEQTEEKYFISGGADFVRTITSDALEQASIFVLCDISWEKQEEGELCITKPQTWDFNGKHISIGNKIIFRSDVSGVMHIENEGGSFDCGGIRCETPQWEYQIAEPFGSFTETGFYAVNAKSVNGIPVDKSAIYFKTADELLPYIEDGIFASERLSEETKELVFAGDYEVTGFRLETPLNLTFRENIRINGRLDVSFYNEGEWKISSQENVADLSNLIQFDVPYTAVVWEGEKIADAELVEQYMNYRSYNGQERDVNIGGDGNGQLLSGSFQTSNGGQLSFQTEGNYIRLTLGYTSNVNLNETAVTPVWSGEAGVSATIKQVNDNYYCVTTDQEGKIRGYKLIVESKEYSLPVVYLNTDDGAAVTSKEDYKPGTFTIDYNGTAEYVNLEDVVMKIKGRGNSSWELEKKPYKIKFDKKQSLFGLTAAKEWCVIANHTDRSLIRNTLAMNMAKELDNLLFVPTSTNVDVFFNGAYVGVYSICEQIEMKDGRIPGEKDSTKIDADYLLEMGGDQEVTSFGDNIISTELCGWTAIKTPGEDVLTSEQYTFISDYINKIDESIMSGGNYEDYIDVMSLVDYFILHEFSYNVDGTFRRSNFMVKRAGGKLVMASPWDYDYAFGNMTLDTDTYDDWISLGNAKTDRYDNYISTNWMDYLLQDERFLEKLKNRWAEVGMKLRDTALATIDGAEEKISASAEENFAVWNIMGKRLQYESNQTVTRTTYAEQLQYLRDYINKRYEWMNRTITSM